jgi:hypothetical protein
MGVQAEATSSLGASENKDPFQIRTTAAASPTKRPQKKRCVTCRGAVDVHYEGTFSISFHLYIR